jgi:branched-chain amino acid transport system substrate-binding protein
MKKFLTVSLLVIVLAFTACDSSGNNGNDTVTNDRSETNEANETNETNETNEITFTGDDISVGIIAPLSGGAALFGIAARNGATLAFDQINEAGGVLGSRLNVLVVDDAGDIAQSVTAYNRLAYNDNVVGIVGPVTSGPSGAVADVASDSRMPMISPTATAEDVTLGRDHMFRACFLDATQARAIAEFAYNQLEARTASILFNNATNYSRGLAENFTNYFEALGGTIINAESYSSGDVDFRAQLTTIAAGNPEILFLPEYFNTVALKVIQAREAGIEATLLGGDGWEGLLDIPDFDASVLDGSFFSAHFASDDSDPIVQNFVQTYTENFGTPPSSFAALGFDAAKILAQAIADASSTDNDAIISAMQNINFYGATGNITFDENGNPIKPIVVINIENSAASLYYRFEAGF